MVYAEAVPDRHRSPCSVRCRCSGGDEDHKLTAVVLNLARVYNQTWKVVALVRAVALGLDSMGISSSLSFAFSLYASLPGVSRNTPEKTICTNSRPQDCEHWTAVSAAHACGMDAGQST